MSTTDAIEKGQYWIVENDAVALVIGRNSDNSYWLVNRVDPTGGCTKEVGVAIPNFKQKISADDARSRATLYVMQKLEKHLNFA